jgi:hypothetical protein
MSATGMECPLCGLPVVGVEDVINGPGTYDDTQGGHNDRHTLVLEAAARAAIT